MTNRDYNEKYPLWETTDVFYIHPCGKIKKKSILNPPFYGTSANSANVASAQVLHCLLTEVSFKI